MIRNPNIVDHSIGLFLHRNYTKNNECEISTIEEIYISSEVGLHKPYFYVLQNGNVFSEEDIVEVAKDVFRKYKCIYRRKVWA
jgi:hypothetical protein